MAVMDFRDGGFGFTRSRQKAQRDYDFEQKGWDDAGADVDQRRFAPGTAEVEGIGARLGRLTHYLGAVLSVGLMVGLMIWGWQLVTRDVSGVPVIKAMVGDARIAPDDPGGEPDLHRGHPDRSLW